MIFGFKKMKTTQPCSLPFITLTLPQVHLLLLSFFFPSPPHAYSVCALFTGVLEKTVEGEAAALTKAKTLYKSCTNESESPG